MLTGIGLLAVAGAILIATAVFHMEVKRVYYPQVKWARDQHEDELFAGVPLPDDVDDDQDRYDEAGNYRY